MNEYIETLIRGQMESGSIDESQADLLRRVFSAMTESDLANTESLLRADPRIFSLLVENIGNKINAINSGSMENWQAVVADEIQKLDALEE